MISTFNQTIWWSGCVYWATIGAMIASTDFISYWKPDLCEGLRSKLCSCSNQVKSWLRSNFESITIGFKTWTRLDV
jgi:hypothetical protein